MKLETALTLARYIGRRTLYLIPQLIGITLMGFILVRLIPGDLARQLVGPFPEEAQVDHLREQLGLAKSAPEQYFLYLKGLVQGDWGFSWSAGQPVVDEFANRLPATLELITITLVLIIVVMIPLGVISALHDLRSGQEGPSPEPTRRWRGAGRPFLRRSGSRVIDVYGFLAGSFPEFLIGLMLIYVFYTQLGVAPSPTGRLDVALSQPAYVTGAYTLDSLLALDWVAFRSAVDHLALPVITLAVVYGAAVLKMTRSAVGSTLASDYVANARAFGLPRRKIAWYALRNALPPIIVLLATVYGFLLGGAVLVESVFSINGIGRFAVQAVTQHDYAPIQGFLVVSATFFLLLYLLVDLVTFVIDPRARA
jgi:ABC-type dipeptide/oligopeptide/nickel transport system permease component